MQAEKELPRYSRTQIAARIAADIDDGMYVNLGIGIPTLVADAAWNSTDRKEIVFHSENGLLGCGPAAQPHEINPDVINAGKEYVTVVRGACFMNHADSFALIRGHHLDIAVLGAYQVSVHGDLANWTNDVNSVPAVGGAMDLAVGAKQVWIAMTHLTGSGQSKLIERCTYPLTAERIVRRVYTDLAVFKVTPDSEELTVVDIADGLSFSELQEVTDVPLRRESD